MKGRIWIGCCLAYVLSAAVWIAASGRVSDDTGTELLNVSYDPTRELWRDLNGRFIERFESEKGVRLSIRQSHGGSGSQARAVIDGLEADVVTLAMHPDTDAIRRAGLIAAGWEDRLPNRSLPYLSTIVFVVREGNPRGLHDWPDLIRPGVRIITPNPKTSGNGKWAFLAAWGSVIHRGGTEADATEFVRRVYAQVPVLDSGARGATMTFAQKGIGDVHLTWENEAHLEVQESGGKLEIVYPPASIRAEPHVALVDANVRRKGTRPAAEAYLRFLYTPEAQEVFASHHYRPTDEAVVARHRDRFPAIDLFPATILAPTWSEIDARFFAEGAAFDRIMAAGRKGGRP
jgi:sulfate transport system substrate-binding protein